MESVERAGSPGWVGSGCVLPIHVDRPRHRPARTDRSRVFEASFVSRGRAGAGSLVRLSRDCVVDQPAAHSPARQADGRADSVPAESFAEDLGVL